MADMMTTEQPLSRSNGPQEEALRPGALRGQTWLMVQTRQAQQLIRGRNGTADKPAIIGLVGFADRLRMIWQAARQDDPYADWWLIKVHEAIEQARAFVDAQQLEQERQFVQVAGIETTVAESLRPYRVPLQFANPYAYRGAHLIAEYDTLVRTLLTRCHVGLLDRDTAEATIHRCARRIRGTFAIAQGYRFLGIDRPAVRQGTGKSEQARQRMGELPAAVLSGEQQAQIVPRKVVFPKVATGAMILNPLSSDATENVPEDGTEGR